MKTLPTILVAILLALVMSAHVPHSLTTPILHPRVQSELDALVRRGFTYRFLDDETIELTETWSGNKQVKSLREPSEAEIRAWAAAREVPILEIDPAQVDTNTYSGWFTYMTRLPLSNSFGDPLVIGDQNKNGKADVHGIYYMVQFREPRLYEVDTVGNAKNVFQYPLESLLALGMTDVDKDSLCEVMYLGDFGNVAVNYEQKTPWSLPTNANFQHSIWERSFQATYTPPYSGDIDDDTLTDFLYKGSECHAVDKTNCITGIYVAEYDAKANNFTRVWSTDFDLSGNVSGVGGFAVDDFDRDGRTEFVSVELATRRVLMVENTGNDMYVWTWQDSTPFVNLYYTVSEDVDHDGKPEFFVGATSNGSWTTMYEADSSDHYAPQFIIHLLSGGLFDQPTYLTTDIDADGILELVIMSGNDLYIFKSSEDNAYVLWYLKREDTKDAVQFYDFNRDGKKDFVVSKYGIDSLGQGMNYADCYMATSLVSVRRSDGPRFELHLKQNYPNPFNPVTMINYQLARQEMNHGGSSTTSSWVTLKVYDLLGREVMTLVDGEVEAGSHSVQMDGSGLSSGIYFYTMRAGEFVSTRKLLLLK